MTTKRWEVIWEGELPASPEVVWDAITRNAAGYLWPIFYEPRLGGAERGLTSNGGTVTAWEPARHFATSANEGFNELDYVLEPLGAITYLRYVHRSEVTADEFDVQLDACRRHTAFYQHSLEVYACYFGGREAAYVSNDDVGGSFAEVKAALAVPDGVVAGDAVTFRGIEGVVDYANEAFLGVRTADALYRVYGRDAWGWPVGIGHHFFGDPQPAWADWKVA